MKKRLSMALVVAGAMAATALLFGAGPAAAATNVYCPSDDLQSAIDNASQGATLTIFGICYGNFVIDGTSATNFGQLTLQGGSSGATLNGRGTGSTLVIELGANVTIRNLTITNGNANAGGGLHVTNADLTMVNATVKGNRADQGGGIGAYSSEVDLTGVTVTRNSATYQGGGIDVAASLLSMTASTVSSNTSNQLGLSYGGGGIRMIGIERLADEHEGDVEPFGRLRRWYRRLRGLPHTLRRRRRGDQVSRQGASVAGRGEWQCDRRQLRPDAGELECGSQHRGR